MGGDENGGDGVDVDVVSLLYMMEYQSLGLE